MKINQQKQAWDIFKLRANFELVCLIDLKYKYRIQTVSVQNFKNYDVFKIM